MAYIAEFRTLLLIGPLAGMPCVLGCDTIVDPIERGSEAYRPDGGITECVLTPQADGWVESQSNPCGVQGSWYSYNDCNDSPDCTRGPNGEPTQTPGEGSFPNEGGRMCTEGVTAVPANEDEMSVKWGAGIALHLNEDEDGNPRPVGDLGIDLIGFRFTVEHLPEKSDDRLRVNFPTADTDPNAHYVSLHSDGTYNVHLDSDEIRQGDWVVEKTPLDPATIEAVQFQVPTEIGEAIDFDFCVSGLTVLLGTPL